MLTSALVQLYLVQTIGPLLSLQMHPSMLSDGLNMLQPGGLQTCAEFEDMLYSSSLDPNTSLDLFNIKFMLKIIHYTFEQLTGESAVL
jgi:hypothetical protein